MTSPFIASLHVALGGAIGSVLRYQTGRWMTSWLGPQAVMACLVESVRTSAPRRTCLPGP